MTDLTTFNPPSADALLQAMETQAATDTGAWWKTNSALVEGYLKAIATATAQTQVALAEKRITADTASTLMQMHADTLKSTLQFAVFMTEAMAQKLVDGAMALIVWAIYNKTGVNIAPDVVKPAPAAS